MDRPILNNLIKQLRPIEEKAKPLDERIIRLNEEIRSGKNEHIKIKTLKDGSEKWTLPYLDDIHDRTISTIVNIAMPSE